MMDVAPLRFKPLSKIVPIEEFAETKTCTVCNQPNTPHIISHKLTAGDYEVIMNIFTISSS